MSLYYQDPTYVMLIDEKQSTRIEHMIYVMVIDVDQAAKIDHAMLNNNPTLTLERSVDYWLEAQKRFLGRYNARYGQVIKKYNPYVWRRELIFNTEQDAVMFCLKVL
jgi:hypothetical protein